jgi:hypothetical protein
MAAWPAGAQSSAGAGEAAPAARLFAPAWTQLHFVASKLFVSASTTIVVERVPAATIAAGLRVPPQDQGIPLPSGEVAVLTTDSDLPFGRTERMTVWLDPVNGTAIQAFKETRGHHPYAKLFRYTTTGCFVWRSAPADEAEARQGVDAWSKRKTDTVSEAVPPGVAITDPYALIYLVSSARLDRKGATLALFILTDSGVARVDFAAEGLAYVRRSFVESWPGGERSRQGNVLVRVVRGTARLLAGGGHSGVELGFLGLRDGLTIFLEAGTGIPIELTGDAAHVGRLTVRLDRAVLRSPPE